MLRCEISNDLLGSPFFSKQIKSRRSSHPDVSFPAVRNGHFASQGITSKINKWYINSQ